MALLSREAPEEALEGVDPAQVTGPRGLIAKLAGRVVEAALGGRADRASRASSGAEPAGANVRNGGTSKTLTTDLGPVRISTPRDRDATFEPQLVAKASDPAGGPG